MALRDELALDHVVIRLLTDAEHAIGRLVGAVGRTVNPFLVGSPHLLDGNNLGSPLATYGSPFRISPERYNVNAGAVHSE